MTEFAITHAPTGRRKTACRACATAAELARRARLDERAAGGGSEIHAPSFELQGLWHRVAEK